jgi:hypothetical protein
MASMPQLLGAVNIIVGSITQFFQRFISFVPIDGFIDQISKLPVCGFLHLTVYEGDQEAIDAFYSQDTTNFKIRSITRSELENLNVKLQEYSNSRYLEMFVLSEEDLVKLQKAHTDYTDLVNGKKKMLELAKEQFKSGDISKPVLDQEQESYSKAAQELEEIKARLKSALHPTGSPHNYLGDKIVDLNLSPNNPAQPVWGTSYNQTERCIAAFAEPPAVSPRNSQASSDGPGAGGGFNQGAAAIDDWDEYLKEERSEVMRGFREFSKETSITNPKLRTKSFFGFGNSEAPDRLETTPFNSKSGIDVGSTTVNSEISELTDDLATTGSSDANEMYVAGGPSYHEGNPTTESAVARSRSLNVLVKSQSEGSLPTICKRDLASEAQGSRPPNYAIMGQSPVLPGHATGQIVPGGGALPGNSASETAAATRGPLNPVLQEGFDWASRHKPN